MMEEESPALDRPEYRTGTVQGTGGALSNWIFWALSFQWVLARAKLGFNSTIINVGMGDLPSSLQTRMSEYRCMMTTS